MPEDPKATIPEPSDVLTVDALGGRARAQRDQLREEVPAPAPAPTPTPGITIGRYQLLGLVGAGGMGMVFGAWDPELDRRVALKLVRSSSAASRERMLREGQILARLSHPNVVPVFDVGEAGDQVYLVMEYVRGTTLDAFATKSPGRRDVLDAYRQAGAGLAAAHRAGVIHRDFKPSNAIRGDDGRVRVLDFGIAHTEDARDARGAAGTPRYMAPEQAGPGPLTAAADQYAFCVSLREALAANGGVPAWIAAIVARGTQVDPAQRFGTFDELLAALAHDPARRWRRIAIAAGVAIAAGTAFTIGQLSNDAKTVEPCVGGPAEIAQAWRPETRARLTTHLRALGPRGEAEGTRLAGELDRDATAWIAEHRATCLANERKELSPALHGARLGCLARTRASLAAVADLVSTVDAAGLDAALFAARMRPDVHGCADASDAVAPPPAALASRIAEIVPHIERALVLATASRVDAAPAAAAAVAEARVTSYPPLVARALLVHGRALLAAQSPDAEAPLAEAMQLGLEVSDDPLAVEAYARWVFVRSVTGSPSSDNLEVMKRLATRLGARGRFARALLYNNLGVARLVASDLDGARLWLEQAATEARGAPEIELAIIGLGLANLEATPAASLRRIQATYQRYLDVLGPLHVDTRKSQMAVGTMTPDRAAARGLFPCDGFEGSVRAECLYEAAWLADEDGDLATATQLMARRADSETELGRIAGAYVALRRAGSLPAAARRDLEAIANKPIDAIFQRGFVADALVVLALASAGPAADRAWQRASETLAPAGVALWRRRLARADAELAERWAAARPVDAAAHARRALTWYREAPSYAALVARLEAITAAGSR